MTKPPDTAAATEAPASVSTSIRGRRVRDDPADHAFGAVLPGLGASGMAPRPQGQGPSTLCRDATLAMSGIEPRAHVPRRACRTRHAVCSVVAATLASACGGGSEGIACTTEMRTSVLLTVVDQLNAPLAGVVATYRVNDGASRSQPCESNGTCALGLEDSGVFAITAAKAGHRPASATVTVTRDECHVRTERLTLMLAPAP